jgi:hypothetical protein
LKKVLAGLVVLLIAGAFAAGYWPQRQKLVQARAEAADAARLRALAESRLAEAEAKVRVGELFGRFLALRDAVEIGDFPTARSLSSKFFDGVREEGQRTTNASVRAALDSVQARRDAVTASLARIDGGAREMMVAIERELRQALGYPVLQPAAAKPGAEQGTPKPGGQEGAPKAGAEEGKTSG